ncbi:phosphatase PAP2 family protein [Reichenbachiella sp. MALMAid0571]|uniref:phosphatase PAP2 family protein n=1 Tax=Reichenbachiella sp. MALMAid0571 TaxID=3143939 RepID=UPI0032DEE1FB
MLMKAVSIIFHPLLMPSFTFLIINATLPELVHPIGWVLLPFLFITTFLIPLFGVSALIYSGSVSSFSLEKREERFLPFLFVTIFYTITTVMFILKIQVNETVGLMLVATTVLILILMLISLFYKISIHSAGVSGVVGFMFILSQNYPESMIIYALISTIVLSGLVMTSRLYLNAHRPKEILFGCILGISVCAGSLYFFD